MTDYFLGKKRWGKPIAARMLEVIEQVRATGLKFSCYIEAFFGMGHVAGHLLPQLPSGLPAYASDANAPLMQFWQALQTGTLQVPATMSRERALALQATRDLETPLHVLVGYACSWGGRYFDSVREERYDRNRASLLRVAEALNHRVSPAHFEPADFFTLPMPRRAIVYLDPPYETVAQTTLRRFRHCGDFDNDAFWRRAAEWAHPATGNLVFVSERTAPRGWEVVWEQTYNIQQSGSINHGVAQRSERLYCYRPALAHYLAGRQRSSSRGSPTRERA